MASKQSSVSPLQSLLNQNRFKCVTVLSYSKIASFLLSHSVLSEDQHVAIKKASTDSTDRMDDLLSLLYQLNSIDAFHQFRNAVMACGHFRLAESLVLDDRKSDELSPVLNPTILAEVFAHLPKSELWNVRRVCHVWNDVVCTPSLMSPTVHLKSQNDLSLCVTSTTTFYKVATNFRLSINEFSAADKSLWTKFSERFGNNIKALDLTKQLSRDAVKVIFSKDIQKFFVNLIRLRVNVSLEPSFVEETPLSFLAQLKHLTIEATEEQSEYGQIAFLSKLLKLDHQLESLALLRHFCIGEFPSDILPNLFRTSTIESIEIVSHGVPFLSDNEFKAMTNTKNAPSKLQNIKFLDISSLTKSIVIHKFLVSHRRTLKRITFPSCNVSLVDLPKLDALVYLNGSVNMDSHSLSFCTQFPSLEQLQLTIIGRVDIRRLDKFKHNALRSLHVTLQLSVGLTTDDGAMKALKAFISSCFPNLKKLEINKD
ncbi:uncharacterized protein LOC119068869 [Bradysia coprophila]|uniref:uncharacterized protein LOC119068869 n=1 Tax=Bradysia coprophila TaxID=38358 RepID=UPI00187D9381|nr:uncharacterized protein LOC119068869 [Bradysia coprophila]